MRAAGTNCAGNGRESLHARPQHHFLLALSAVHEAMADDDARKENRGDGPYLKV
jgi:hypothetical protein